MRAGLSDPLVTRRTNVPDADIYAIDVSFAALEDATEREYLNTLPTSFAVLDAPIGIKPAR